VVTLSITATDQAGASYSKSFAVSVNDINEAPAADSEAFTVTVGQSLNVPASGVLEGDFDPEGDTLTAILLAGPDNGTLTLQADGSFVYTPDVGFTGVDTFIYQASDGLLLSHSVVVTIAVEPAASPPPPPPSDGDGDDDGETRQPPPPPEEPPPEEPPPTPEETTPDSSPTSSAPATKSAPPVDVVLVAPVEEPTLVAFAPDAASEVRDAADENGSNPKQSKQPRADDNNELRSQASSVYQISVNDPQWQELDSFRDDLLGDGGFQTLVVGAAVSTSVSLSVGYVFWTVRVGWLASALMTSMPVWRSIDPLPILEYIDGELDADDESLQSIIQDQANSEPDSN
jgi:hypothetical protein